MVLVLSTNNPGKIKEILPIFQGTLIEIRLLQEVGIFGEAAEGEISLGDNATRKARFAHRSQHWTVGEDTGIFIRALGGKPGVLSKRWAGDGASTEEITEHTLKMLKGVKDRTAIFVTAVSLISQEGREYFFMCNLEGELLASPKGKLEPQMPYSPIFVPKGQIGRLKTLSQMTVEDRNRISHRGKAFREVRDFLLTQVKK